jgi:transposase
VIGLPSLQAMDRAQAARIWLASESTDMRCGFDRLAERVRAVIGEDPLSGHLLVFRSRRGDRLKMNARYEAAKKNLAKKKSMQKKS